MIFSGGELVLSDATPTFSFSQYYSPTGLTLTDLFASYGTIYKRQEWVYTVVRKRALATRRLPVKVYEHNGGGREERRDSPYAQLLRNPNPRMSGEFLWEWTSSTYDVYGEAIWLKMRDGRGQVRQTWPVHPSNIAIERADKDRAARLHVPEGSLLYVYYAGMIAGGDPAFVAPETDIVHFKSYNPESTVRGLSALEPLRQTLLNEDAARRASASFWQNGARPGMALQHPKSLSQAAMERLAAQWDSLAKGVDKTGRTVVLEEGMTANPIMLTAEESQYIETRKLNREEVCGAYDMPPPVVHILDRATFSNITEQMRSLYRDTMAPHLGGFEATLDHQLRPEFGGDGLYAEFLMDQVLRGDFEQRVNAYQAGINSGWLTPAEVREMENLPPVDGADRLFVNSTLIPIDEVSQHTSAAQPALTPPTDESAPIPPAPVDQPKSLSVRDYRSVMGRLGRISDVADVDVKALTAGLNGVAGTVAALVGESADMDDLKARLRALLAEEAA